MGEDKVPAAIGSLREKMRMSIGLPRGEMHTSVNELRGVLMARFERVENRPTSMAEDITVTMMAVEAESKRYRNDYAEMLDMSELMTAMQRQTMRLRTDIGQINSARPPAG